MANARFKITNTTVKPPRIVNGKDARLYSERVGHFVQFEDEKKRPVLLGPGKFSVLGEDALHEWFFEQEKLGEITITQVKDMGSALDEFRHHAANQGGPNTVQTEAPKIRASEMGNVGSSVLGEGVNPDGEPNFVVKAKSAQTLAKEKHESSAG